MFYRKINGKFSSFKNSLYGIINGGRKFLENVPTSSPCTGTLLSGLGRRHTLSIYSTYNHLGINLPLGVSVAVAGSLCCVAVAVLLCCDVLFFLSSGGWVKIKLKLPHFHASHTCRVSI